MNLVDGVGVQVEVVWTAVRILQREVVGHQRDVRAAIGFVAAKHVEIRAVEFWRFGDAGRFAMARALPDYAAEQDQSRDRSRLSSGEPHGNPSFHSSGLCVQARKARSTGTTGGRGEWIGQDQDRRSTVGNRELGQTVGSRESGVGNRESGVAVVSLSRLSASTVPVGGRLKVATKTADWNCRLRLLTVITDFRPPTADCRLSSVVRPRQNPTIKFRRALRGAAG